MHTAWHVCTKGLFIWNRGFQIIYRPKPKIIGGEANLLLSFLQMGNSFDSCGCFWRFPLPHLNSLRGFQSRWIRWLRSNNHNKCPSPIRVITKHSHSSQFGRASKAESPQPQRSVLCFLYQNKSNISTHFHLQTIVLRAANHNEWHVLVEANIITDK